MLGAAIHEILVRVVGNEPAVVALTQFLPKRAADKAQGGSMRERKNQETQSEMKKRKYAEDAP